MPEEDFDAFEDREHESPFPSFFEEEDHDHTETIDLHALFSEEFTESGSFNLVKIRYSSFGRFLQALSVPTLLVSRSHVIEFANDAFITLSGQDFQPAGLSFESLFANPKEARRAQLLLERVLVHRRPEVRERSLRIGTTVIWGRIHLRTIRLTHEQLVLVQIENLTAQKELVITQKYKKLVHIFPIGIAEFAVRHPISYGQSLGRILDGVLRARVVDGNNEFARIYGKDDLTELLDVSLRQLLPPKRKVKALFERWVQKGFPLRSFNTKEPDRDGTLRHFENTIISNVNNKLLFGFWWIKKDISDNKRMEAEFLKTQKLESLGILAGGLAHDFNNLLTGILGNLSIAEMNLEDGHHIRGNLASAAKAATRAQDLTRQLLTFSRGGAPIKRICSIGQMLEDCVNFVVRGSNSQCEFSIPSTLWPVEMDEGQIGQVVSNLVFNAIHAMPNGGLVSVRANNVNVKGQNADGLPKGQYVRVAITDQGSGIPAEHLRKIFDPYFTTKENGTGLGLATSYSIMRRHGGLINVESTVGTGSTFYFYLPAHPSHVSPPDAAAAQPVRGAGRILIMDDELMIRELAGDLLAILGYEVGYAADGKQAIERYQEALRSGRRFDAVIMDLTVPGGMGGKEAFQRIKRIDPQAKGIVSSGYFNDPIMSNYVAHGFHGVLPKPYNGNKLSEVLVAVLGNAGK